MNNNIEQRLADEKTRMESITAPEELEMRLRNALNSAPAKRSKKIAPIWKIAAVVLLVTVISGQNYNAFAYYGKQLFGFDELLQGTTLQQLNNKGMGQNVNKKITLLDGTDLTINGIMADANQFIMYYTLANPNGLDDMSVDTFRPSQISGFLTDSNVVSGTSLINEDHTEIKGTMSFDSVNPFSKKLTLHFWQQLEENGQMSEGTVTFPYNPNEAMQTQIKQSINKKIKVDKGTITFKSITATPTMTVIRGKLNVDNFDRVNLGLHGIQLLANGAQVEILGSGNQTSVGGRTFDIRFDTLPKDLHSLQLVVKEFAGYQKLEEKYPMSFISNKPFTLGDKELWIKEVSKTSQGIEVTIATDDDVMLDGVSIEAKGVSTPLKTTINQKEVKQADGKLMKERTLLFATQTKPESLLIEGMHYMKEYNKMIEIPVN
ncbi:DUF4179 domain-containing protein [Paenibacillus sp. FSL R10-2734]|uniref:DUF4179 domain-containing protein n=1 Tax=Paenibacillus sp. FSL R10-2734 TaxID=2954691 RepID=UPI0030DD7EF1